MSFNNFWKWLCLQGRVIRNLGDKAEFSIYAEALDGIAIPLATKTKFKFTIRQAKLVWDRYCDLPVNKKHVPGCYVDGKKTHNWSKGECPYPRQCNPWIAAAIRDFESEK